MYRSKGSKSRGTNGSNNTGNKSGQNGGGVGIGAACQSTANKPSPANDVSVSAAGKKSNKAKKSSKTAAKQQQQTTTTANASSLYSKTPSSKVILSHHGGVNQSMMTTNSSSSASTTTTTNNKSNNKFPVLEPKKLERSHSFISRGFSKIYSSITGSRDGINKIPEDKEVSSAGHSEVNAAPEPPRFRRSLTLGSFSIKRRSIRESALEKLSEENN